MELNTSEIYAKTKEIQEKSKYVEDRTKALKIGMTQMQEILLDRLLQEVLELAYLKYNFEHMLDKY